MVKYADLYWALGDFGQIDPERRIPAGEPACGGASAEHCARATYAFLLYKAS